MLIVSAKPRPELVAKRTPGNACIRIGIGLGLPPIQFVGKGGGNRRGGNRVQAVPEATNQRNALLG